MNDAQKNKGKIIKSSYKPLDNRYTYFTGTTKGLYSFPRLDVMKHLLYPNVALVVSRQCASDWRYVYASDIPANLNLTGTAGRLGSGYVFPLYLYPEEGSIDTSRRPNLDEKIWAQINTFIGKETTPEDIFDYIYGILHSPSYRAKYKEFLKVDFPRILTRKTKVSLSISVLSATNSANSTLCTMYLNRPSPFLNQAPCRSRK